MPPSDKKTPHSGIYDGSALPLIPDEHVALAVSGGADSVAAAHLLCSRRDSFGKPKSVTILHYHHGLREESDAEFAFVRTLAEELNCRFIAEKAGTSILNSNGNTQQNARTARYAFFEQACLQKKIKYLVTAHHSDDQAETVLMRLLAGAGAEGLQGIPEKRQLGNIICLRPFLTIKREILHEALPDEQGKVRFYHDTSNENSNYSRTRIRNFLKQETRQTTQHILSAAHALECDTDYINQRANQAYSDCITHTQGSYYTISEALLSLHPSLLHRILNRLYRQCGGKKRARSKDFTRLIIDTQKAMNTGEALIKPFAGYVWRYLPENNIFHLHRDHARCEDLHLNKQQAQSAIRWDSRFKLRIPYAHNPGTLLPLKAAYKNPSTPLSLHIIRKLSPFPFYVTDGLPVLRRLDNRLSLPHIFKQKMTSLDTGAAHIDFFACIALNPQRSMPSF